MLVRNTFLELVPEHDFPLRRAQTTPAGEAVEEHVGGPLSDLFAAQAQAQSAQDEGFHSPREEQATPCSSLTFSGAHGDVMRSEDSFHSPRESLQQGPQKPWAAADAREWSSDEHFESPRQHTKPVIELHGGTVESLAQPQSGDSSSGLSVCVRNTFLDVRLLPEPPAPLLRAMTSPTHASAEGLVDGDDALSVEVPGSPPPQQLPLESFVTDDRFEEPVLLPAESLRVMGPAAVVPAMPAAVPAVPAVPLMPAMAMPPLPLPTPACVTGPLLVEESAPAPQHWPQPPPPPPPPVAPPTVDLPDPMLPAVPNGDATLSLVCQPNKLTCARGALAGWSRIQWAVDARKLEGKDKQAVSPEFILSLPSHGPAAFKITIYPRSTNDGRGGGGFRKAKGRGRVELKCEAQLSRGVPDVVFFIGVGIGDKQQPIRGPVAVNFLDHSVGGLAKSEEEWDFASATDDDTRTFLVFIDFAPPAYAHVPAAADGDGGST
mmetsp:Transcript_54077/g.125747  ORF Transcript_54077/g.125747 Transcript_54077/m.125747 type:complete len:490 (+) Transcript_54077:93-1562(+)